MARRARRIAVLMLVVGWLLALLVQVPSGVHAQPGPAPAAAVPAQAAQAIERTELRGVWLTANDMPTLRDRERMQATVAQLAALNFNTL